MLKSTAKSSRQGMVSVFESSLAPVLHPMANHPQVPNGMPAICSQHMILPVYHTPPKAIHPPLAGSIKFSTGVPASNLQAVEMGMGRNYFEGPLPGMNQGLSPMIPKPILEFRIPPASSALAVGTSRQEDALGLQDSETLYISGLVDQILTACPQLLDMADLEAQHAMVAGGYLAPPRRTSRVE